MSEPKAAAPPKQVAPSESDPLLLANKEKQKKVDIVRICAIAPIWPFRMNTWWCLTNWWRNTRQTSTTRSPATRGVCLPKRLPEDSLQMAPTSWRHPRRKLIWLSLLNVSSIFWMRLWLSVVSLHSVCWRLGTMWIRYVAIFIHTNRYLYLFSSLSVLCCWLLHSSMLSLNSSSWERAPRSWTRSWYSFYLNLTDSSNY